MLPSACTLAVAGGIAVHLGYFNRYECHMHGFSYLSIFCAAVAGGLLTLTRVSGLSTIDAAVDVFITAISFLAGLSISLLTYRLLFNPLNRFPGPWWARTSNLYFSTQLGKSNAYYKLQELHRRHGSIVRIGSNDLSIADPDAVEHAYGLHATCTKSAWYDGDKPLTSMHTSRSKSLHDKRRRVWAPAFSDKALRDYETKVEMFNDKFMQRVSETAGSPMNATKWFNLYSFDVMGRLAFGKDYGMLESGEKHWALSLLSEGMQPLALMLPIWLFRMLTAIPGLEAGFQKFVNFCIDEVGWRVEQARSADEKGSPDIMSWLLKAYKGVDGPQKDPMLQADARLIIVAGSDTTAAALTCLFYHLAQNPTEVSRLREELRPLTRGEWSDKDIRQALHLNGAINESLRLHPPVPSGLSRMTPPQGLQIGEQYVPGNVTFIMPQYVMGRGKSIPIPISHDIDF